jgi:hypothetical protein
VYEKVRMRETMVRRMEVAKAERLAREARKRNYGRVGCNDNAPREIGGSGNNRKLQDEGKLVGHQRARKVRKARYRCQILSLDLDVEEELAFLESELDRCLQKPERRLGALSMSSTKAVANLDLHPDADKYAFFRQPLLLEQSHPVPLCRGVCGVNDAEPWIDVPWRC